MNRRSLIFPTLLLVTCLVQTFVAQTLDWQNTVQFNLPINTFGRSTAIDGAGNLYLGGVYDGNSGGDSTGIYLIKYSTEGALLWSQRVRTSSMYIGGGSVFIDNSDHPWLICFSESNKIVIGTTVYSGSRAFMVHFNSSGKLVSVKNLGYNQPVFLSQNSQGNIFLTNYGKIDTSGNVLQPVGGYEIGGDDSGYVYQALNVNTPTLRKINAAGNMIWTVDVPEQTRICVSKNGNVYTVYKDQDGNSVINKYHTQGYSEWLWTFHDLDIRDIYVDEDEIIYFAAVITSQMSAGAIFVAMMEPYWGNVNKFCELPREQGTSLQPEQIIARNGIISVAISDKVTPERGMIIKFFDEDKITANPPDHDLHNIRITPNPSSGKFNLKNLPEGSEILIFNQEGKCVYTEKNTDSALVDLSALPRGLYIVKINSKAGVFSRKLLTY